MSERGKEEGRPGAEEGGWKSPSRRCGLGRPACGRLLGMPQQGLRLLGPGGRTAAPPGGGGHDRFLFCYYFFFFLLRSFDFFFLFRYSHRR